MRSLLVVLSVLTIWPFGSGGKTYRMMAASFVPAAHGTVQVNRDKNNGNTKLDIKVANLANPASLTPPENVYIVWVLPRNGEALKEGAIAVDKNLNGELKATTTSRDFDVSITAEQSESVDSPSAMQVLHAHVSP